MAYAMTKQGSLDNCVTYEFICDTIEDMNAIENRYRTIGSIAIVLQGASGLEVYISGSDKQWNSLSSIGSSSSDTTGLSIYICAQDEVSNGVPDVDTPDEATIYLVPAADSSSGNLYDEYIYANDNWEKFGSGSTIDLSGYYQKPVAGIPASDLADGVIPDTSTLAPKASPIFTGSISLGRKDNTSIGVFSTANGENVTASGYSSHAEGSFTTSSGAFSHAEGSYTSATNLYSHAEGNQTTASGTSAHSEGVYTRAIGNNSHTEGVDTTAKGEFSHAEGTSTIANGSRSHVAGQFNVEDSFNNWNEWIANTSYSVGDKVKRTDGTTVIGYVCKTANSDSTFTSSKWTNREGVMNYAEIIGNGTAENSRSNARALDWDGNEHLMGDIYVGCNADSTGGTKLPRIPEAPSNDGSYILQTTVTNGTPTYTWVSLASLSGVTF